MAVDNSPDRVEHASGALTRSIWVRRALTTRMASEGSLPLSAPFRAAVRLSTCTGSRLARACEVACGHTEVYSGTSA